jgi:hypothetical protein
MAARHLAVDKAKTPEQLVDRPFERLPPERLVTAFGVEYGHLVLPEGGDLYVTRFGWPWVRQLMPAQWYAGEWYAREGEKLPGATGQVYHVRTRPVSGRSADLVVKFSRVAQEASVVVETSFPDDVPPETIAAARFNSPMEEFGLVMELRRGAFGPAGSPLITQRPMAIYAPPEEFPLWQLGRMQSMFQSHSLLLAEDQEHSVKAIELDIKRIYVLLYGWIKGKDAEQSWISGDITDAEFQTLVPRVVGELKARGFRVLDNKARHFVLRRCKRNGHLMRRPGQDLLYGLVDFEFLQRTAEHQAQFRTEQQERYRKLQAAVAAQPPVQSHLSSRRIYGVEYVHGSIQDGGRLWVVGTNYELFDYFLPDRWRRTPRLKLSPDADVFRTRTRDNIHVVYRRSRVGSQPRVDPLTPQGRELRAFGYNGPFEEVVIAERLRQLGVPTVFPRAVYRTGHPSTSTAYAQDMRRFQEQEPPDEAGAEAELIPGYDYYTVWSCFRGVGPGLGQTPNEGVDVEHARAAGMITPAQCQSVSERMNETLGRLGLDHVQIADWDLQVYPLASGELFGDSPDDVLATLGLDALRAYDLGLLDDDSYRATISRMQARLHAADCEQLDLRGTHILLSLRVDGNFSLDREGEPVAVLCNFEFVRGLYRPIR